MMDYSLKSQFPSQALIQGLQQKPVLEQQMAAARQKQMSDALSQLTQGLQTVADKKRRMAAAMTMSQSPSVQESLGAGQMVGGSIPVDPEQQIASVGGRQITPGMTAQGGTGDMSPVPNTGNYPQPNFTPDQIEPMLGEKASSDYFGDVSKMGALQRLQKAFLAKQQAFQAKGNVVTPVINPIDGSVNYNTTQVTPGSTIQHPVRLPRPAAPRAAAQTDEYNQLLNNRKGLVTQRGQFFDPNDPRAQALDQQISSLNGRLNKIHPLGTPGANSATGAPARGSARIPQGYPAPAPGRIYVQDQQGAYHTVPQEQLQDAINQGYSPV